MSKPTSVVQTEPWMPPLLPGLSKLTNSKGELYGDFRKRLLPNYLRIQWSILLTFLTCVALSVVIISNDVVPVLLLVGVVPLSLLQLRLLNVIHEGAHYLLARTRPANDLFCNLVAGWIFVVAVDQYRITHIEHHRNLGEPGDPENAHMDELDLTWLASAFSGLRTIKTLLLRKQIRHDVVREREKTPSASHWIVPVCGSLIHLTILSLIMVGGINLGEACWIAATYFVTPGLGMLRNLLEHRYVGNVDPSVWDALLDNPAALKVTQATTRTFTKSILSQLYGSMGFTRHLLHHWDPSISFQNLKEVHNFILDSKIGTLVASTDTTFTRQFASLWKKA
jgi:fatty acid desaturase